VVILRQLLRPQFEDDQGQVPCHDPKLMNMIKN
jgi:hypothetical protein